MSNLMRHYTVVVGAEHSADIEREHHTVQVEGLREGAADGPPLPTVGGDGEPERRKETAADEIVGVKGEEFGRDEMAKADDRCGSGCDLFRRAGGAQNAFLQIPERHDDGGIDDDGWEKVAGTWEERRKHRATWIGVPERDAYSVAAALIGLQFRNLADLAWLG